ncbi:Ni/Fe hydrogenase subunit alpha [Candidatus Woesearchaeota archaeon]|jgi:sulfhydrogenase subunit alpha|nr:Ni/Fe hydrogenase subunit alpha [Candidatus Woesearchaeota archaeon]
MSKTINLNHITKIEGHAKLHIVVDGNKIKKAELKIFEGSRYFEGILKGKKFDEVPIIASRICGVCSVVHTIAANKAIEDAFEITVSKQTKLLRELLNIGGIIQSHVLHLYFLVLPDYYGYSSAIEMAPTHKELIKTALRIKKAGNKIVRVVAGRDIHPIAEVIGGLSRTPDETALKSLLSELKSIKKDAKFTLNVFDELDYPSIILDHPYFGFGGGSYFYSDKVINGLDGEEYTEKEYEKHFKEFLRKGSTAEFATKEGKTYMVGALPRILLRIEKNDLKTQKKYLKKILNNKWNPYMNVLAQAIEINEGIINSIEILEQVLLNFKKESPATFVVKKSEGIGRVEAPRGMLFHQYKFDSKGNCTFANITTPTTQNLAHVEDAIKILVETLLLDEKKSKKDIKLDIEKLIRAYDPCISCSTHFLELNWEEFKK